MRESEKLKTVLKLYDLEIHQKKAGPGYHRLKTMVKRSIEQDLRNRNFGARNGNYERNAVSVDKEFLEIVGNWKPTGSALKETIAVSVTMSINVQKMTQPNPSPNSFMQQDERKTSRTRSPRGKSPSGRMSRWPCKDYFKGTCTNSFCEKWHPPECLFYKTKSGCRFGEKCAYAHRQVDEQPSKRLKENDKSALAMLVAWKVVLYCSNRASIFRGNHPSVSNSLDCNDWAAYKHHSIACGQTRLDNGSLLFASISFHLVFQHALCCIYLQLSVETYLECFPCCIKKRFKHPWIVDPCLRTRIVSIPQFQTLDCGSVSVYMHLSPVHLCSNTVESGHLVVHMLRSPPVFQTHFVVPGPCTSSVYSPLSQTRLNLVSYFVYPPAHSKMRAREKILQRSRAPNQLSIFLE